MLDIPCGCDVREETIGANRFWTGTILASAAVFLGLTYGGTVSTRTKTTLRIAAVGAITAIIADQMLRRLDG